MPRMTWEERAAERAKIEEAERKASQGLNLAHKRKRRAQFRKKLVVANGLEDIGVVGSPHELRIMKIDEAIKDNEVLIAKIERLIERENRAIPGELQEAAE